MRITHTHVVMPFSSPPRVDFVDFEEFQRLVELMITMYEAMVERRTRERVNGWLSWPNFIMLNTRKDGAGLLQIITKGKSRQWCLRVSTIIDVALRETMRGILDYHNYEIMLIDPAQCCRVLTRRIAPLIEDLLRGFFADNMMLVPFIPRGMRLGPTLSWQQVIGVRLALCMGSHARLGAASFLFALNEDITERVAAMLFVRPELMHECII